MKTCDSCKHWDKTESGYEQYGKCVKIHLGGSQCPESDVDLGGTPAFTEDGSGYKADLFTLSSFGCTLHEEKTL